MHVFIPIFFNAPLGGLQSHVSAQVHALVRSGHHCTVMCKPGPFADTVREQGARVLKTGYESLDSDVAEAINAGPFNLVHAHPFASRAVGLELARKLELPFLVTFHGAYTDSIEAYARETALVIAVSPAIRDRIIQNSGIPPHKVVVLPNGVDTDLFYPRDEPWEQVAESLAPDQAKALGGPERRILFVSRMDDDKQFILDLISESWTSMLPPDTQDLVWLVAGDGSRRKLLEKIADQVNTRIGRELIVFLGWQEEETLARLYSACHLVIAPGRSALDCMACGTPVVAVGSAGYLGLIDEARCLQGGYTNFGGIGSRREDYQTGTMLREVLEVIRDGHRLERLGKMSIDAIRSFFEQRRLNEQLLGYYRLCTGIRPVGKSQVKSILVDRPKLAFHDGVRIAEEWTYPAGADRQITPLAGSGLRVACRLSQSDKFYLTTRTGDFAIPPVERSVWGLEPGRHYELSTAMRVVEGSPQVQLWVIQYDDDQRLAHSTASMRDGVVALPFTSLAAARSFKAAFRFSGSGTVEIDAIELFELCGADTPETGFQRRSTEVSELDRYQGENLVFVLGPPRSGTTWVLKLLNEHPDVEAATLDNLDVRLNDAPTLETNIFNDNRPYPDEQILQKFHDLSRRHPGRVIVEKTPIHLLFVDRIRRIFPRAALVLVERDGRDVVNSLIHVGRDKTAWWQGAPDTVEKATRLWKQYAEAGLRCRRLFHPLVVSYEKLVEAPDKELGRLLSSLGLSGENQQDQLAACRGGANISIPGVFREGKSGSWRQTFDPGDIEVFKRTAGELLCEASGIDPKTW